MHLNYEENFKIPLRAMRMTRTDPTVKRDLKCLSQFALLNVIYTVVFILMVYNILFENFKARDFSLACQNVLLSVVFILTQFQYGVMMWEQPHLKILMNTMKTDFILAKSLSLNEQEIIHKFAMKGNRVCRLCLVVSISGTVVFFMKNFLFTIYYWVFEGKIHLTHVFDFLYLTHIEQNKNTIVVFSLIFLWLLSFGVFSCLIYCAFVPLGPILLLHGCGQLEVVKSRIDNLFKSNDLGEVTQKLKDIVRQLQFIYA